jgi:hypothetical protein
LAIRSLPFISSPVGLEVTVYLDGVDGSKIAPAPAGNGRFKSVILAQIETGADTGPLASRYVRIRAGSDQ